MAGNKQTAKGNDNVQQQGEVNIAAGTVNFVTLPPQLTMTDATELLKLTLNLKKIAAVQHHALPADFEAKIKYNGVVRYRALYMSATNSAQMSVIDDALQEMPDSEPLIERLVGLFLDVVDVKDGHLVVGDGDVQLKAIESELLHSLEADPQFPELHISMEVLLLFVHGFISYGISICKVLINPNQEGV